MIVAGTAIGKYVGLPGRADQQAVAALGVLATAAGLIRSIARGKMAISCTLVVGVAASAAIAAILAPDILTRYRGDSASRLLRAAAEGNQVKVRELLAGGADANRATGPFRFTPLLAASRAGQDRTVRTLLEAGADPNLRTTRGQTPLMVAAMGCHREVVHVLLKHGATTRARTSTGLSARDFAEGCPAVRQLLTPLQAPPTKP
jgi:ankyrin repeat protein